jgi:kynurenine formamidase
MKLIDLSHTIERGMPVFSDQAPQPRIEPWMSHAQAAGSGLYRDCTCEISEVQFVTSLGTYLDSPYHFDPNGVSIEGLNLEQLILPGVVVDCTHVESRHAIGPDILSGINIEGKAVFFRADWSRYWGYPEYFAFPYLSAETARVLNEQGAKMVGVDFLVVDDLNDPERPVHVTLLSNNILIVENLTNLAALPARPGEFIFHAVPVKFKGAAAFPVRAYAQVE